MFHEIRGPLNIIIAGLDLLKMELFDEFPEEVGLKVNERIQNIDTGVYRVFSIIKGLQGFAQGTSEKRIVSIDKLVRENIEFSQLFLKPNKVSIKYKNNLSSDISLNIQDSLVAQVITNLLKNSCDAISAKPIFNRWINVSLNETNSHVWIEVTDSGDGINEENQKKLFMPGFTTKREGQGFGIGLPFCKKIVEKHQGSIFYQPRENTCFVIKFPKELPALKSA